MQGGSAACVTSALWLIKNFHADQEFNGTSAAASPLLTAAVMGRKPLLRLMLAQLDPPSSQFVMFLVQQQPGKPMNPRFKPNYEALELLLQCMSPDQARAFFSTGIKQDTGEKKYSTYSRPRTPEPDSSQGAIADNAAAARHSASSGESVSPLLVHAARSEQRRLINFLLDHGCDASLSDSNGWTAVHWAAWYGDVTLLQRLLSAGADPNAQLLNTARTPLHLAAISGYSSTPCINVLLAAGANLRAVDKIEVSRAMSRANFGAIRIFQLGSTESDEHQAETYGSNELTSRNECFLGLRPIELAVVSGADTAVRRLGEAMLSDGSGLGYGSRWDALKFSILNRRIQTMQILLNIGADIEAVDDDGYGAVHWAVCSGSLAMVQAVVAAGGNPQLRGSDGLAPADLVEEGFYGRITAQDAEELMRTLARECKEG